MTEKSTKKMNRRSFLQSTAAVGAGIAFSPMVFAGAGGKDDDLRVAILGAGAEGQVLMDAALKIPGLRFVAVCDIWEAYNQKRVSRLLKKYKHDNNTYIDYKDMLDKEKDLDAVVIATPDFWHSEHACACMEAGLNVYCEKEMSNTLEGAKKMVETQKKTGKLLQIGHQRRSNPRYLHCYNNILGNAKMLGRITTVNGQWNRAARPFLGWPKNAEIPADILKKYGFASMTAFRNWRWYKGLGGGPIVDLGSHQIDIYTWFLKCNPTAVMATGGTDYYDKSTHQWYDTVQALLQYDAKEGTVRAFYQVITTNSNEGYYETFMGDQGTLQISEAASRGKVYPEPDAPSWDKWVELGYVKEPVKKEAPAAPAGGPLDVRETAAPPAYDIPVTMEGKPYHQPHLENFFNACRGKAKLNCPAEIGYETAATVLKINQAVEAQKRLLFNKDDFAV